MSNHLKTALIAAVLVICTVVSPAVTHASEMVDEGPLGEEPVSNMEVQNTVDPNPPTVSLVSVDRASAGVGDEVTVSYSVSDPDGVASVSPWFVVGEITRWGRGFGIGMTGDTTASMGLRIDSNDQEGTWRLVCLEVRDRAGYVTRIYDPRCAEAGWEEAQGAPTADLSAATFEVRFKIFPDVIENAWYEGVVLRAFELGLLGGYDNGNFGPNDSITRGQVAVVLWKMANQPGGARDFPDVRSDDYFYQAVRWAGAVGIVNGYGNGNFGPNDKVTREQLAVMLANYARYKTGRQLSGSAADYGSMSDAGGVSSWAESSVGWCCRHGILSGSNGQLRPQGNASRAEAAKMVVGLYDLL